MPQLNTAVMVVYNPPKPNFDLAKFRQVMDKMDSYLMKNELKGDRQLDVTLMGDFNFPPSIVTWEKWDQGLFPVVKPGQVDSQKEACRIMVDMMNKFGLTQIVDKPTRKNNILDLVMTNDPHAFSPCKTFSMKPHSDHRIVKVQLTTNSEIDNSFRTHEVPEASTFNYYRADKVKVKEVLKSTNWSQHLLEGDKSKDIKTRYDELVVKCLAEAGVPRLKRRKGNDITPAEVSVMKEEIEKLELVQEQDNYRSSDKEKANEEIKIKHEKIQAVLDDQEGAKEKKLLEDIKKNPRAFYKHANKTRKGKTRIGPLFSGGKYDSDPKRMADILSQQYEGVFSTPMEDINHHRNKKLTTATLNDIEITGDDIIKAISEIKNDSSAGPDGIPVKFYKDYAEELVVPLLVIWRHSLDTGDQPDQPILAVISPLHKGGPKCFSKNYRPVALTNHLTKIFERILRKAINNYLDENELMNPSQHGFRSGRSTMTQLLGYYESIMDILVEGHSVDSIYLDFSKAFDKVDHNILLAKLANLGIGGKIHAWITSFLKNRQQMVRVDGCLSEKVWVRSGVPQGSVLGPLLFLIMMLDITNDIQHSHLSSFADDTRLWMRIRNLLDTKKLQEDLDTLYKWSDLNNMAYNSEKFEGQSYGRKEEQHYKAPDFSTIAQNNVLKDLGVYMAEDMKFQHHINNMVARGQRMSGWVLRTIRSRRVDHMKMLLKSLVRSQLEYCCMLWSPREQYLINLLESVQADFTRKISKYQEYDDVLGMPVCSKSYPERLKDLKLYSLERRRERMQIFYLYKVVLHAVPNPDFLWTYCPRNKLMFTPKISTKQGWIHTLRNSSFAVIGPKLFNSIPKELRELPDLSKSMEANIRSFKINVDKYLSTIPDIPGRANSLLDYEGIDYGYKYVKPVQPKNRAKDVQPETKKSKEANGQTNSGGKQPHRSQLTNHKIKQPFVSRWNT